MYAALGMEVDVTLSTNSDGVQDTDKNKETTTNIVKCLGKVY